VVLLYVSYFLHNYISWMKIRPFLAKRSTIIYLGTLFFVQPYWAAAAWTNFENFNGLGDNYYRKVRPWEAFARYIQALFVEKRQLIVNFTFKGALVGLHNLLFSLRPQDQVRL
jgi:hypothetical protein